MFFSTFSCKGCRGFHPTGQWEDWHQCVMLQAMYIHNIHLCNISLIFFYYECAVYTTASFSLFQHTNIQMFPWQQRSHDDEVQGFTHFINNPSVLMGAEHTLTINIWFYIQWVFLWNSEGELQGQNRHIWTYMAWNIQSWSHVLILCFGKFILLPLQM